MDPQPAPRSLPAFSLPPRPVPWSLAIHVLFGGFYNQFGWFLLGFGMVFFWVFGATADLSGPLFAVLPVEKTSGVVQAVEPTNYREGGDDDDPGTPVTLVRYTYQVRGERREMVGYRSGPGPVPGTRVAVEVLRWDPRVARIEGMRRSPFGATALIVAVFPLIGAGFLFSGLRQGIQAIRLMRAGRFAAGKLIGGEPTNVHINQRPVMKLTFEFEAHDGSLHLVDAKTHQPASLEDETVEPLLYDPADPSDAVLLDGLPGPPHLSTQGTLLPAALGRAALVTILRVVTIIGHGVYLGMRWLH